MNGKVIFILIATILIFALGIQLGFCQSKEQDSAKIIRKLDEVLANQAKIFEQFDEIRQELAIIKMRATR